MLGVLAVAPWLLAAPLLAAPPPAAAPFAAPLLAAPPLDAASALPSWNDTAPRKTILAFVDRVTRDGSPDFVPAAERIATFDNDGTLWVEQPMYVQLAFAIDRVKTLAPRHPEWKTREPFASLLKGDLKAALAGGEKGILQVVAATHTGVTTEEFSQAVTDWIAKARHPGTGRPYTEMVYQPMLELLAYLRAHGFKTYIVSGGGIEFMRPWTEKVYGIPPEQVIGSYGKLAFEMKDGQPQLRKLPEIGLVDDKEGKPVGIQTFIGRRPIAAFGNSDGDLQMLQWTNAGAGARLALIVHHTDGEREWAYDRASSIGRLDKALDEARARGWTVVDMKRDWRTVFPPDERPAPGTPRPAKTSRPCPRGARTIATAARSAPPSTSTSRPPAPAARRRPTAREGTSSRRGSPARGRTRTGCRRRTGRPCSAAESRGSPACSSRCAPARPPSATT
jgi:phosphoglycolate phosphatase-like HAD superfamily hydrolase